MKFKKQCFFIFIVLSIIKALVFYFARFHNCYFIDIWNVAILNLVILVFLKLSFEFKSKIFSGILWVGVAFIFVINANIYMFIGESARTYVKSPKNGKTLIISERQVLTIPTSIKVYERKLLIFKKRIATEELNTEDVSKPFEDNHYKVNWINENEVEIQYPYKSDMPEEKWKRVKVKLK